MSALVLWGGDDHRVRGEALATMYGTTAQNITGKPKKVSGLTTLVCWGHGDSSDFCHLKPDAFLATIADWQKLNSGLNTIEMLTCNARHSSAGFSDSYTEKLVTRMSRKVAALRFKALPVATTRGGEACNWSILKWHLASKTWAYVAAPTFAGGSSSQQDSVMHAAVTLLEDFMPPRGTFDGYARALATLERFTGMTATSPYAVKRKWTQLQVDAYNQRMHDTRLNSFIMAGTLSGLRWWLSDIK